MVGLWWEFMYEMEWEGSVVRMDIVDVVCLNTMGSGTGVVTE